ncbi:MULTISPECIES: transporter substrate-binding domain-containing protein [Ramlibacter]|jgi:glutamate/aspartate transport system substrate-binding protein|uniref:Transporter substrate-binding domain-containing protein n=1 Tax=Ramlibacter pinisoli TaxID=2682844 RepID=A0A6N8IUY5_9BURK|nr:MULTISPECIES: transporter substrate-binding domain-containing protein [Ramlibacter]MBA2965652.1 transporter substrate-binding domain-containing protein [Ramlibacter sp. CGMCC 1.13660]MVQ30618.1 transporter substrate-binding domain-containing protein [Ramlibacter pinisoli]
MKRMTLLPLVLALAATGVSAQETLKKVADTNKLTLAYRESSVPFSYLAGPGKPVGMMVEVSEAIAAEVKKVTNKPNLEVAWQAVTSQNRIPLLSNGTIDVECGSTTNNSTRGKEVAFAINHFYTGTRLLVKKNSGIKSYADLKGKTISTTAGTTNFQVLRKYNQDKGLDMNILTGKDHDDSKLLVESGRSVAFGMDDILLFGLKANDKNPADWDVVGEPLQVEPYACMLRKDDPQFKQLVDRVIGNMMKSGEFEKLYAKWFTSPIPPNNMNLGFPMAPELKDNLKAQSDKPAT